MPKIILISLAILIAVYFGYTNFFKQTKAPEIVIKGDYVVAKDKSEVLKDGTKLVIEGDANISGKLECQNGPIYMEVSGNLTVDGVIKCQRSEEEIKAGKLGMGMIFVISGSTTLSKESVLITNGNLQFVDSEANIAKTQEDIEKIFNEVESGSAETTFNLVSPVYANAPRFVSQGTIVVGKPDEKMPEDLRIPKPPRGTKHIIINYNLPDFDLELKDQIIVGPDGLDGEDILSGCDINIPLQESDADKKAKDALRFNARARNIYINNFDLWLGSGGKGGYAQTSAGCYPEARAVAGDGGKAGNFRFNASEGIYIEGPFNIHPGIAGEGGSAVAVASDGKNGADYKAGEKGGNANAKGGNGADNIKDLSWLGAVKGSENITVDAVIAGAGGNAGAKAGHGGEGGCEALGGGPGEAKAQGGKGGKYGLKIPKSVKRVVGVGDSNGPDGRSTMEYGQKGKNGLPCGDKAGFTPKTTKPEGYAYKTAPSVSTLSPNEAENEIIVSYESIQHNEDGSFIIQGVNVNNYQGDLIKPGWEEWDIRTILPVKVELFVNDKLYQTLNINENTGKCSKWECSNETDIPISSGAKIKLKAYDKNGNLRDEDTWESSI